MDFHLEDTIAALASAPGPAGRGVVRLSGPGTRDVLAEWFEPDDAPRWANTRGPSRHAGRLHLPDLRVPLTVDVQFWPGPRSLTGQALAELHLPGAPPLLERVLAELFRRGARPAGPGEFTLRAFLAGKMDLLQAEAVLGVIDAADHVELQTALSQLAGGVSHKLLDLRRDLLELLADLEAGLDFVEEHLEFVSRSEIHLRVVQARRFLEHLQAQAQGRLESRTQPRVVLAGLPNAGKSTLFNALCGAARALVSTLPGTTRDFLTATVRWRGIDLELIDTAGWDDSELELDRAAQQQRALQLAQADVVVWCSAADLSPDERARDDELHQAAAAAGAPVLRVVTKADAAPGPWSDLAVSAAADFGWERLAAELRSVLDRPRRGARQWLGATAARCQESLAAASAALRRAEAAAEQAEAGEELLAIELRDALEHLGQIVGAVYTDDLLDRIFSKFCIGK